MSSSIFEVATILVVLSLLPSSAVQASPQLALVAFEGKGGAACAARVEQTLQQQLSLQNWQDRPPAGSFRAFQKWLQDASVSLEAPAVLFGTFTGKDLVLELYDARGVILGLRKQPVGQGCKLSEARAQKLIDWLLAVMAAQTPPKVEASKVEAPKVEAPKVEAPKVEAPKVEAPKVEAPKVEPAPLPIEPSEPILPLEPPFRPRVSVSPELGFAQRSLRFEGPPLWQAADARALFLVGIGGAVTPFSGWAEPLEARFVFRSATFGDADLGVDGPTGLGLTELRLLLGWRFTVSGGRFTLIPSAGFAHHSFVLTPLAGARRLLPSVVYRELTAGLAAEVPMGAGATLLVEALYLESLSGGPLFPDARLPGANARGVAIEVGVRLALSERLSVDVLGRYLAHRLTLGEASATDAMSGLRAALTLRIP